MDEITFKVIEGVADVRLNRSAQLNALNTDLLDHFAKIDEKIRKDSTIRAVVLSGEGRAFCSGLDRTEFGKMERGERKVALPTPDVAIASSRSQSTALMWRDLPVPVIAAIHGHALGGGLQIALGADIRMVHADTRLCAMEILWGLIPDMSWFALTRGLVRPDIAQELVLSGRTFGGEEAVSIGICTRIADDPREEALALARVFAAHNPQAVQAAKRLFRQSRSAVSDPVLLGAELKEQAALMGSPNQREAVRARLEGRAPQFAN